MKIIFLDIDGVLNVISQGSDQYGSLFHKHFVDNLRHITENTNAKIVISSSWRTSGVLEMQNMWKFRNLPSEVIDVTPYWSKYLNYTTDRNLPFKERCERGYEIYEWLENHPEVTNYVIIDDDVDILTSQKDNFIRTYKNLKHTDYVDYGYGLTKECAERAIKILNK